MQVLFCYIRKEQARRKAIDTLCACAAADTLLNVPEIDSKRFLAGLNTIACAGWYNCLGSLSAGLYNVEAERQWGNRRVDTVDYPAAGARQKLDSSRFQQIITRSYTEA